MREISLRDLEEKINNKESLKLVFCMPESRYRKKHIPGSICLDIHQNIIKELPQFKEEIAGILSKDDEIILYCTDVSCNASITVYRILDQMGYENFCRFSGGLREWQEAGHEVESD